MEVEGERPVIIRYCVILLQEEWFSYVKVSLKSNEDEVYIA